MIYNILDLYGGNISKERLNEIAVSLELKYDESKHDLKSILGGLEPALLRHLEFDIKFKNGWNSDEILKKNSYEKNFLDTLLNVSIASFNLKKREIELIRFIEQTKIIRNQIDDIKESEKKENSKDAARIAASFAQYNAQQIEALEQIIKAYIKERDNRMQELGAAIDDLNGQEQALLEMRKKLIALYSKEDARMLRDLKDDNGQLLFPNLSNDDANLLAFNLYEDFLNIEAEARIELKKIISENEILNIQLNELKNGKLPPPLQSIGRPIISPMLHTQKLQSALLALEEKIEFNNARISKFDDMILGREQQAVQNRAANFGISLNISQARKVVNAVRNSDNYQKCARNDLIIQNKRVEIQELKRGLENELKTAAVKDQNVCKECKDIINSTYDSSSTQAELKEFNMDDLMSDLGKDSLDTASSSPSIIGRP